MVQEIILNKCKTYEDGLRERELEIVGLLNSKIRELREMTDKELSNKLRMKRYAYIDLIKEITNK